MRYDRPGSRSQGNKPCDILGCSRWLLNLSLLELVLTQIESVTGCSSPTPSFGREDHLTQLRSTEVGAAGRGARHIVKIMWHLGDTTAAQNRTRNLPSPVLYANTTAGATLTTGRHAPEAAIGLGLACSAPDSTAALSGLWS